MAIFLLFCLPGLPHDRAGVSTLYVYDNSDTPTRKEIMARVFPFFFPLGKWDRPHGGALADSPGIFDPPWRVFANEVHLWGAEVAGA